MCKLLFDISFDKLFKEGGKDLIKLHWEELALNKDKVPLAVDYDKYNQLQKVGVIKTIGAYKENKLVGYSVLIVQPSLHYSTTIFAQVDVIYVHPDERNSNVGAKLLIATEKVAKEFGASVILHHAKPYVPMIIKPLEKLNYELYEHIYGKYIGE